MKLDHKFKFLTCNRAFDETEQIIKAKQTKQTNKQTKQVLFCNSFKIRNMLISIFMSEALEEIKNEIQIKESFKTLIKDTSPWLIWWGKSNIVHICCARIPNQNENPHVEHRFPF